MDKKNIRTPDQTEVITLFTVLGNHKGKAINIVSSDNNEYPIVITNILETDHEDVCKIRVEGDLENYHFITNNENIISTLDHQCNNHVYVIKSEVFEALAQSIATNTKENS